MKFGKLNAVSAAIFLIGVFAGSGIVYMISQMQFSQLVTELNTSRRQLGDTRTELFGVKVDLDKAKSPRLPAFVPVDLDPRSTSLLLLDFTPSIAYRRQMFNASLPNIQAFLAKTRNAGVPILYTRVPVPELASRQDETVITNDKRADKFFETELESWLRSKQVKTLVITGVATNGAVMYTAFAASLRGFTVVVAADGAASDSEFIQNYTLFQLLNQPGRSNPENRPLAPNSVTLSTTALIRFET